MRGEERMKVTWEVTGNKRTHVTTISDDTLAARGTDDEREELIDDIVQAEFTSSVSWREIKREP